VLSPELSSNAEVLKRFLEEGRIQARLRHPNVVAVTEIVTEPVAGLVMEYVEGGNLAEWLATNGRVRTRETLLELFLPVVEAVGEAHAQGVVQMELHPSGHTLRGRPQMGCRISRGTCGSGLPRKENSGEARGPRTTGSSSGRHTVSGTMLHVGTNTSGSAVRSRRIRSP
jgi:hypothetical protein